MTNRNLSPLALIGTDTDAGKTIVGAALTAYWSKYDEAETIAVFKPLQSGVGDVELYHEIFGETIEIANSIYLKAPLAPPVAAEQEGVQINLGQVWQDFQALCQRRSRLLVETLGGIGSPVTWELTVADLIHDWRLPALLIVPVRLGSISQAVAAAALAREAKVNLIGIVLNCVSPVDRDSRDELTPIHALEQLTHLPVLGCVPHLEDIHDQDQLAEAASNLNLEAIEQALRSS